MIKKFLVAAAIVALANPAIVSAQDIFFSFSDTAAESTTTADAGTSGSVFIFSEGLFGFDALDLNFTSSDSTVLALTGGEGFNPTFTGVGGTRFDSADITTSSAADGNLFAVSVSANGVNPALGPLFDPEFVQAGDIGPNGAVPLARVDFDVVAAGEAELTFSLGPQGALALPQVALFPTFGTASLTAVGDDGGGGGGGGGGEDIPEPSSAVLLILGSLGMAAVRRKKA